MIPDDVEIKREKEAARVLRKSAWWKAKIHSAPICHYCQLPLQPETVTMDHKIPLAQGGKSIKGNVVIACKPCNTKKGAVSSVEALLAHPDF
jgi:5-methylcytosine-specific restriction protein A